MKYFIGIDLGTSATKLLLVDERGTIINSISEEYPIYYPQSGWSQQNPEDWFFAIDRGIPKLLMGKYGKDVCGISFGGQMHGLVILDENDNVIRPCILWNDGRTQAQTDYLNGVIGKDKLSEYSANIAFAGFTAPKLLWLKQNERANFDKIAKIMLPKDYLTYRLTGVHATDYSDASGTLLLDVKNRCWSKQMCDIVGIEESKLPKLYQSFEKVGYLYDDLAARWGVSYGVIVAAGAGDNAAAAVGTGAVLGGECNISLGTSGTVFICQDEFSVDSKNALHSFCHATGKYHLMGCILSAAACNAWWMDILQSNDFEAEQQDCDKFLGENDVFFLPYLMGERSPHNDVNARGAFIGLRPTTSRKQMTLAVMEGVAFALKDCVGIAKANGVQISKTRICGGGAKSQLWRTIIANVLGIPVEIPAIEQGPAYGAAMLAMIACGIYRDVPSCAQAITKVSSHIYPDKAISLRYNDRYNTFRRLYPALKGVFSSWNN
jgi:xylulokinase